MINNSYYLNYITNNSNYSQMLIKYNYNIAIIKCKIKLNSINC